MKNTMVQAILASVGFDVSKQFKRYQETPNCCARKLRRARDIRDRQALRMPFESFDHTQAARERQHKIGVAFVYREFSAPAGAEARQRSFAMRCARRGFRRNWNFQCDLR